MLASLIVFIVALGGYVSWSVVSRPARGGVVSLIYGISGYGAMLFAGLLGARKKVPVWRVGRAKTWMRGHLWLGLLTLPLILFHSGFSAGGSLTSVLMLLLILVWLSGITGAAIQHFVPGLMTSMVPLETIYEEIPRVREQLRDAADRIARAVISMPHAELAIAGGADQGSRPPPVEMVHIEAHDREYFASVYRGLIQPFLRDPDDQGLLVARANRAEPFFEALRLRVPAAAHGVITELEGICEEERQLNRQKNLYVWLHGWLLVHVPLSITLLVMGGIHGFVALRY